MVVFTMLALIVLRPGAFGFAAVLGRLTGGYGGLGDRLESESLIDIGILEVLRRGSREAASRAPSS